PEIYTLSLHDALPISQCGETKIHGFFSSSFQSGVESSSAHAMGATRHSSNCVIGSKAMRGLLHAPSKNPAEMVPSSTPWRITPEDRKSTRLNSSHSQI